MRVRLTARALWELARYDLMFRAGGLRRVHRSLRNFSESHSSKSSCRATDISKAMRNAQSLYWKRALCLQRSVATTRLLRQHGIRAELVIGYRADPFMSHAWVEIDGQVVNDSPAYQQRLRVLERL